MKVTDEMAAAGASVMNVGTSLERDKKGDDSLHDERVEARGRISMEVLDEYRKIVAWLEAQAALRRAVGDTMHGLAAEALTELIEREYSRHMIPLYGMLDVWQALYGTSHPEFDEGYEKYGYAETWARLLTEVRSRATAPAEPPTCSNHRPVQHRDGKPPWCNACGRATVPDAATEAIDRVRALHLIEPGTGPDYCAECEQKYPCPTIRALDGAPEPEGRWEYRGRLQSCGYVAEGYVSAEHAMNGLRGELEDHPYLVMDDTAIVERARVREWLPVEGEGKP